MSLQQLSEELRVPTAAISCGTTSGDMCKTKDCCKPALAMNYGKCAWCRQGWYPKRPEPGHLLLGPEYMYRYNNAHQYQCDCGAELCSAIGYTSSLFFVPAGCYDLFNSVLPMQASASGRPSRIAFWHFPVERRKYIAGTNRWNLIDPDSGYVDSDGKSWRRLVPINSIRNFIDNEATSLSIDPRKRWQGEPRAPDWACKHMALTPEPAPPSEVSLRRARATSQALEGAEATIENSAAAIRAAGYTSLHEVLRRVDTLEQA